MKGIGGGTKNRPGGKNMRFSAGKGTTHPGKKKKGGRMIRGRATAGK